MAAMSTARLMLAQLAQGAMQRFNFPLVIDFLPLGQFEGFEDFFHLTENMLQLFNDLGDLLNGGGDTRGLELAHGFGLRSALGPWLAFRLLRSTLAIGSFLAFRSLLPFLPIWSIRTRRAVLKTFARRLDGRADGFGLWRGGSRFGGNRLNGFGFMGCFGRGGRRGGGCLRSDRRIGIIRGWFFRRARWSSALGMAATATAGAAAHSLFGCHIRWF